MAEKRSDYEHHQIESLLLSKEGRLDPGVGLFLVPQDHNSQTVYDAAVAPAMRANGLNEVAAVRVFGSDSQLSEVCWWVQTAEVIVAELSTVNADIMYVLGLCHGLRRCPLIICEDPFELPFNLAALRWIKYDQTQAGMWHLRDDLARAIRVQLTASRAGR